MTGLVFDVVEEILIRMDVEDLIRCKSVHKSWQNLISSPRFVKAHLNHNIKSDRDNQQLGHRRIDPYCGGDLYWNYFVGSCNGLVCINPEADGFLVTNPSTIQQRILQTLPYMLNKKVRISQIECWGFGYDSSSDDYKVVAGLRKDLDTTQTTFHVLTLKSNTWKVIGEVKYHRMGGKTGILCDGTIYWLMANRNRNSFSKIIISLDLSTDELKEIPLPDDADYNKSVWTHQLGLVQDCLCIQSCPHESSNIWVMKNNKWELYIDRQQSKYDVVHRLNRVYDSQNKTGYVYTFRLGLFGDGFRVPCNGNYISSSIFVKSLVSPHFQVDEGPNKEDNKAAESGNTKEREREE